MLPVAQGAKELVYVAVRAKNVAADPFGVVFTDFTLGTTDGLLVPPAAETLKDLKSACAGQAMLDTGGQLRCVVAFEVETGTAKDLVYRLPSGKSLRLPLPPRLCNTLPSLGEDVTSEEQKTLPTVPSGGVEELPNGDYFLTKTISSTSSMSNPFTGTITLHITDDRFELVSTDTNPNLPPQAAMRASGTVKVDGKALTLTSECVAVGSTRTDRIDEEPQPLLPAVDHAYFPEERRLVIRTDYSYSEYSLAE